MALNNVGLGFIFSARDYASRTIDNVAKSFGRMERATTSAQRVIQAGTAAMATSVLGLAAGLKILQGAWFVADASGEFEQALNRLAVASEATTEQVTQFRAAAMKAGVETKFNPTKSVKTLDQLVQVGLTADQALKSLSGTLDFAAAAELEGSAAANTLAAAIKVFGEKAENARMISDKLMKTTTATAVEAHELEIMLGTVSRGAGQTGQSLDEMLVAMGMVKNTGVDATVAASSVSTALMELSEHKDDLKKLFDIDVTAEGKFRPFLDIILELNEGLNKIADPADRANKAKDLAGRFGLTALTAISRQVQDGIETTNGKIVKGAEAVAYLRDQLKSAEGMTQKFKDAFFNSLPGQVTLMKGAFESLAITVGDSFAKVMRPGVERVIRGIQWLVEKFEALPEPIKKSIAVAVYVTSAVLILGSAVLFVGGAIAVLLPLIPAAIAVLKGFAVAMAPVLVAAAALGLAFFTMKQAYDRNINGFGDRVNKIFNKVKLAFQGITQFFRFGFIRGGVAKELAKKENEGVLGFIRTVVGYVFRIKKLFGGIFDGFMASIERMGPAFDFIIAGVEDIAEYLGIYSKETADAVGSSDKWYRVGRAIGLFVGIVAEAIIWIMGVGMRVQKLYIMLFGAAGSILAKTVNFIVRTALAMSDGWASFKESVSSAYNSVKQTLNDAWTAIATWVDSIIGKFRSLADGVKKAVVEAYDAVVNFFKEMKDKTVSFIDSVIAKWDGFISKIKGVWTTVSDTYDKIKGVISEVSNILPSSVIAQANVTSSNLPGSVVAANTREYLPTIADKMQAQEVNRQPTYAIQQETRAADFPLPTPQAERKAASGEEFQVAMQNALAAHSRNQGNKKPESMPVYLDGEKVGYVLKSRERGMAANSFDNGSWGEG